MSNSSMPDSQNPVLDGAMAHSLDNATQYDRQELVQSFQALTLEQKLSALTEASSSGEQGLALLNQGLEDADLRVRTEAYRQLKNNGYQSPVLERGIPLRVGDLIYAVYTSPVTYGDDLYYIHSEIDEEYLEERTFYHALKDSAGERFEYIADRQIDNKCTAEDLCYSPNLLAYFVDKGLAEEEKEIAYLEGFKDLSCKISDISPDAFDYDEPRLANIDLHAWAEAKSIILDPTIIFWFVKDDETIDEFEYKLIETLHRQKKFNLLRELWPQIGYDPLAFVHEYEIDRLCYLKLNQFENL
jgi:hypothetical protein